jgi:hypothetical protein
VTPAERAALRLDWLAGTTAEIERRQAAKLEASGGDERERLINTLREMAQRLTAAPQVPINVSDLSIAEKLAIRCFWPDDRCPEGLGTEKEIWAEYAALK